MDSGRRNLAPGPGVISCVPSLVQTTETKPARLNTHSTGLLYGIGAYGIWGLLPLYFLVLLPATALEIVANRVVWSLLFCAVLLTVLRSWRRFGSAFRDRTVIWPLTAAAVLIALNWYIYTLAATTGHVIEASLGYFINPLVSVLLGVLILKERLRPLQWVAVGIAAAAVVVLTVAYGTVPWLALGLAFSFGLYGFVKKQVGSKVDAVVGLSVETAVLTPVALAVMAWLMSAGTATITTEGTGHFWLMAASGIITATPLILFSASAARLPLSSIGMLQYMTPLVQFVLALTVLGEQMALERWIGFILIWVALGVLSADVLRGLGRRGKARRKAGRALARRRGLSGQGPEARA